MPLAFRRGDLTPLLQQISENVTKSITNICSLTLRDEFDFGQQRINRFINRFNEKTDVLVAGYASWEDYEQILLEEVGIDCSVPDACKKTWEGMTKQ